ncbi:hypothetical protein BIW11_09293 [Tropilaelaps mercedesae]|uniref:Uncharacterized protein n=1 Tax=Tropilaelaps mercedesae TaxID=418985 RepID=A0A1V9XKW3_9ACAR|nr:hypothetical protein BIW11_09293 [Tropilaelaps mercedesae]
MTSPRLEQASPSHSPYRELVHYKQINQAARQQGPLKACGCFLLALFLYADVYYIPLLNSLLYLPELVDYFKFQSANRSYRLDASFERLKRGTRYPNSRALDWHIEDESSADAYLLERSREQQSFVGCLPDDVDFGPQPSRPTRTSLVDVGVEAIQRLFQTQPYKAASPSQAEKDKGTESGSAVICTKWNIDERTLFKWNRNLRFWFHKEVFHPLCKSIREVNENIGKLGFGRDYMIGVASPTQLRHLAALRNEQLPGALSKMNWNHGGPSWNEQLPPDAEILMFSFFSFIDSRLPPDPEFQEGRQFTKTHTKESLGKSQINREDGTQVLIHHRTRNPPHYQLQLGRDIIDVGPGSANALHTIISFLYHQKMRNDERICRMSMGPTGLNLLCIIT